MRDYFRRLAGVALAGVMVCGLSVPAFAAVGGVEEGDQEDINVNIGLEAPASPADITMNGRGGSFEAYRLLDLTTSLKMDHEAHEGGHGKDCYNYSYTLNDKYTEAIRAALGNADATQADIVAAIGDMADQGDDIRGFADAVFELIKNMDADATATNKVFVDVPQGYYLIVERTVEDENDAISLVMLDTAGQDDISVTVKDEVPKLTKKLKDTDDTKGETSDWQDAGDFDIGDDVEFQLTGTLPANIMAFDTYQYIFHDTLSEGLSLNPDSIVVKADGNVLAEGEYAVRIDETSDGCSFEVEIADVMGLIASGRLTGGAEGRIVVEYTAKLTDAAKTGVPGNENEAYLEFSRNPYDVGEGTSKTPKDKVIGFTYKLEVDKVDGAGNPLAGAGFQLYKYIAGEDGAAGGYQPCAEIEISAGQTEFRFNGLDAGKYKLIETQVPAGYNKAEDIEFEVVAVYEANADTDSGSVPELTGLQVLDSEGNVISGDPDSDAEFEVALSDGNMVTAVVNSTGVHLPTTGGAGAYLLYGLGGLAVIGGAGVIYVTTKRKGGAHTKR